MIAGVAWGMTMVNLKQPVVLEALLRKHGFGFGDTDAFANGVMSALIMRKDTTPDEEHIASLLSKMRQAGARVEESATAIETRPVTRLRSVDMTTEEHPGFATDLQAQFMALMTGAAGISFITENIFENRFMHVPELARMGANIRIEGRQAIVAGPSELTGAQVMCSDLRASASLVLAALVAHGESILDRVYHMDRGYEKIEEKLAQAGARIERIG